MKNLIAALAAIFTLASATPVFAEIRIGALAGSTSTSGSETDDSVLTASSTESGTSIGVFGQWRTAVSDTMDAGIHLGYSVDSAGSKESLGDVVLLDGNVATDVSLTVETDSVIDLMGVMAWKGGSVRPFIMAGYSIIKIEAEGTGTVNNARVKSTDDDSASGWKIAIGTEFPLSDSWSSYALIDYADYGEINLGDDTLEFNTEQTGIRFGISYAF